MDLTQRSVLVNAEARGFGGVNFFCLIVGTIERIDPRLMKLHLTAMIFFSILTAKMGGSGRRYLNNKLFECDSDKLDAGT